jgi:hypothetical protein
MARIPRMERRKKWVNPPGFALEPVKKHKRKNGGTKNVNTIE